MAAEQPRIVKGQNHGQPLTERRQGSQIEVPAVQIVTMEDLRRLNEVQKIPGLSVPKILQPVRILEYLDQVPQAPDHGMAPAPRVSPLKAKGRRRLRSNQRSGLRSS